jgi:hypothetical protein
VNIAGLINSSGTGHTKYRPNAPKLLSVLSTHGTTTPSNGTSSLVVFKDFTFKPKNPTFPMKPNYKATIVEYKLDHTQDGRSENFVQASDEYNYFYHAMASLGTYAFRIMVPVLEIHRKWTARLLGARRRDSIST